MAQNRLMPTDPLIGLTSDPAVELFKELNAYCGRHQYLAEHVAAAGINVFINGVRQASDTRQKAERMFDEYMGKMKAALLEKHYDAVTGKRRHNFAFDQTVAQVETFVPRDGFLPRLKN